MTNILMVGPSLEEPGGMGTVQKLIYNHLPNQYQLRHIATWNSPKGQNIDRSKFYTLKIFLIALIQITYQLSSSSVDLLHIHIAERGSVFRKLIVLSIARFFRKPVLLHTHGCEFHIFHEKLSPWQRKVVNFLLQKATYVITLSESWNNWYIENCHLSNDQTLVLKNPVEIPQIVPQKQKSQELTFLSVGKINQRKGIYDILNAIAKIPLEHRQQIKLILAGTGEVEESQKLASDLNLEHQVIFPGWVNVPQRDQLLAEADVFLLPSYNEGLPMALLEAMSWKLPVVTTPVGGIPEVIKDKHTGLLVNPGNIEELSQAMETLIVEQGLRKEIGEAAYQIVKPLSIENYMDSLTKIYDQMTQIQDLRLPEKTTVDMTSSKELCKKN